MKEIKGWRRPLYYVGAFGFVAYAVWHDGVIVIAVGAAAMFVLAGFIRWDLHRRGW